MSLVVKPSTETERVDTVDETLVEISRKLFDDQAATAIALCGIDAWFEGRDEDVARCARVLKRLTN